MPLAGRSKCVTVAGKVVNIKNMLYNVNIPALSELNWSLLAPYDLVITVAPKVRLEIGRFSLGLLPRIRLIANPADELVFSAGAFCEIAHDATIVIGGEHRNESLLNYTFGGPANVFKHFMTEQNWSLCTVAPVRPVRIGDNVVISTGAIVVGGADIGSGSIIGAGAVVTGHCEPLGIYVGIPARRLRDRFDQRMAGLYTQVQLPRISSEDVSKLPALLARLADGEITLNDYAGNVRLLQDRPKVLLEGSLGPGSTVNPVKTTGYIVAGQTITNPDLDAYFAQIWRKEGDNVRWSPDIFTELQLIQ